MLLYIYFLTFLVSAAIFLALKTTTLGSTKNQEEDTTSNSIIRILPVLKGLPVLLAVIFSYLLASRKTESTFVIGIMLALLLCLIGDYLIDKSFIKGMMAFGLGHIVFTISFSYGIILNDSNITQTTVILLSVLIVIIAVYGILFIKYLSMLQVPKKYFNPIKVYIFLISLMFLTATSLAYLKDVEKLIFLPIGALLFVFSDSTIALREFRPKEMKYSVIKVMAPYYLAIFCLSLTTMYV